MAKSYRYDYDYDYEENYGRAKKMKRDSSRTNEAKMEAISRKKARKAERELQRLANSY